MGIQGSKFTADMHLTITLEASREGGETSPSFQFELGHQAVCPRPS